MRLHLIAGKAKNSKIKLVPTAVKHKKRPKKDFTGSTEVPMSQEDWDAGKGCPEHATKRSPSCHDCAMLQPEEEHTAGHMKDLHIDIVDTIEALRSYLEHMETEPETPENSVRYEKAFETKMDLEGMLEGRVPLDIQVVKDAKETYNSEESFERAVEQGYEESGQILREILRDQKG